MNLFSRILLATSALAAFPVTQSLAADYDPPIFVDDAPEYVPVEVGSGWYLRGDISYNFDNPFKNTGFSGPTVFSPSFSNSHTAFGGTIGMGYHFNDYFRAEFNAGFLANNEERFSFTTVDIFNDVTSTAAASAENEMWTGMLQAYADLGTYIGLTPYIGGGVGFVYSERDYRFAQNFVDPAITDLQTVDSKNQFGFAYTLGAGVNYKLSNNMSLDLGYQFLSAPDTEYAVLTGPATYAIRNGIDIHQIKVGLRYDLW